MFVEPVMGAGGAMVPPEGYFDAITPVLDKYGIRLIDDEVISGFGRTGNGSAARLRFRARQHVHRQGAVIGLSADLGGAAVAGTGRDHRGGSRAASACWGMASPIAAIRCRPRWRSRPWRSTNAATSSAMCAMSRRYFLKRLAALARSSAGGRGQRRRPDRRRRAGAPTRRPSAISMPPRAWAQNAASSAEEEGLIVRPLPVGPHRALPAAGDQRSGDRRIVRPPGHARLTRRWTGRRPKSCSDRQRQAARSIWLSQR